jgi:hypothetical protein
MENTTLPAYMDGLYAYAMVRSHRGVTAEHHGIGIKAIHVSGKSCILHTSAKTSFSGVEMYGNLSSRREINNLTVS